MQDKDPIREALEEILAQAKRYQSEPLMSKLKGKMKVAVVEAKPEGDESEDDEMSSLKGRIESVDDKDEADSEPELSDEQKKKLRELLGV